MIVRVPLRVSDPPDSKLIPVDRLGARFVHKGIAEIRRWESASEVVQNDIPVPVTHEQHGVRLEQVDDEPSRPALGQVGAAEVGVGQHELPRRLERAV